MIPATHYYTLYLIIISLMTLICVAPYFRLSDRTITRDNTRVSLLFTVLMIVFIGFRPISEVFADMPGYAMAMEDHRFEGLPISWDTNYVFQPLMAFLSSIGASQRLPIVILAAINFGCTFVAVRKLFPNDVLLAMLVFWGAFSTFGAATNGLKAGCAAALFLIAIAYRENIVVSLLFLFLSLGFHHSMQLPVVAFIICSFIKETRFFLVIWVLCLVLAIFHVTSFLGLFGGLTDTHGANYFLTQADSIDSVFEGKKGFRYDFVLYSAIPVLIGYIVIIKKRLVSVEYQFIFNIYVLVNAIWMLCMYAEFTNRIAYLSWFLYPILLIYPFMNLDWGKVVNRLLFIIVIGHLSFTLFMQIVYYA